MSTPRWITGVIAIFIAATATPSRAHACKCAPSNVHEAYDAAAAVFEGFVKEVSAPASDKPGGPQRRTVRFEVVSAWKGAEGEDVTITTASESAACGYTFKGDQSYLVYATSGEGGLQVTLCSRTRPMAEASEDLAQLGMGATPVDPKGPSLVGPPKAVTDEPPARGGCAGCTVGRSSSVPTGATLAGVAAVGLVLVGRRRRTRVR